MKVTLVLQCIRFGDFTPAEEPLSVLIDGVPYPHTPKKGGYFVLTKQLPQSFCLSVQSKTYHNIQMRVESVAGDKVLPLQLIPRYFKGDTKLVLSGVEEETVLVLGSGYYVISDLQSERIVVKNPSKKNLEGRYFLLRDTQSGNEEFITLGAALDPHFKSYRVSSGNTAAANAVLLPAVVLPGADTPAGLCVPLPVQKGEQCPVWIITREKRRFDVTGGQTLRV